MPGLAKMMTVPMAMCPPRRMRRGISRIGTCRVVRLRRGRALLGTALLCVLTLGPLRVSGRLWGLGLGALTMFDPRKIDEGTARGHVREMKTKFGILEFQFYNAFEGYSHPPAASRSEWDCSCLSTRVDRALLKVYIDEIQNQEPRGRVWLNINAMACDPNDPSFSGFHPLGTFSIGNSQLLTVLPVTAALAQYSVSRWANWAKELGVRGILWSSMGHYGEGCDWEGFLKQAHTELAPYGLLQSVEVQYSAHHAAERAADGIRADFERTGVVAFKLWQLGEAAHDGHNAHKLLLDTQESGAYCEIYGNDTAEVVQRKIVSNTREAMCSNKRLLAFVDGHRRVNSDYLPNAVDMTPEEVAQVEAVLKGENFNCSSKAPHETVSVLSSHGGLDSAEYFFVGTSGVSDAAQRTEFKDAFVARMLQSGCSNETIKLLDFVVSERNHSSLHRAIDIQGLNASIEGAYVAIVGDADVVRAARRCLAIEGNALEVNGFLAIEETGELQHGDEDCYAQCGNSIGYCAWCGLGNACCGGSYQSGHECERAESATSSMLSLFVTSHTCTALKPLDAFKCGACEAGAKWSPTKSAWCQQHENTVCFDCETAHASCHSSWSLEQVQWCEKNEDILCSIAVANKTASTPQQYDCTHDIGSCTKKWSADQIVWCEMNAALECFDCGEDFGSCESIWSLEKRLFCKRYAGVPCGGDSSARVVRLKKLEFDCQAGKEHWQEAWSAEQKAFCCSRGSDVSAGCEDPSMPFAATMWAVVGAACVLISLGILCLNRPCEKRTVIDYEERERLLISVPPDRSTGDAPLEDF